MLLGVDTGGTFTDFVLYDEDSRQLRVHKVLSTPQAPEQAILQGIRELGIDLDGLAVVHGSTVATNAVLEGKGARTVFITNRGLRDLLTIGRQARRELYNLQPARVPPPVPRELCLETGGRLSAGGEWVEPLTSSDLDDLAEQLERLQPEAVAINLLFSFLDDEAERAIAERIPDGVFVSRSSEVLPEYREYERGMATWLNASVGPRVQGYLGRLERGLGPARLGVMQSSGRTIDAAQAGRQAVHMLLSGPAGGLMAARHIGRLAGRERLMTFDMGGTSTDVALIDGEPGLTSEGHIGDYPVGVPMVDMHTIGAGGGSIARVDAGGLLRVGPESAGALPGPVCYGRGGGEATVTDANLVLGRLRADAFLGGDMRLDAEAARAALARLGKPLGLTAEAAAEGVIALANEYMARALRVISVQRGHDPRDFTLMCFGGAGGLHVCALAASLDMRRALVPVHGGVLSAFGMLVAPPGRELSRTLNEMLGHIEPERLEQVFAELETQGREALAAEGVGDVAVQRRLDLRYHGQSYTLTVDWLGLAASVEAFHAMHETRYGHRLETAVELVNVRVGLSGPAPEIHPGAGAGMAAGGHAGQVFLHGVPGKAGVFARHSLAAGQIIEGPALVTEQVATTYIEPGWQAEVDAMGNLLLDRR